MGPRATLTGRLSRSGVFPACRAGSSAPATQPVHWRLAFFNTAADRRLSAVAIMSGVPPPFAFAFTLAPALISASTAGSSHDSAAHNNAVDPLVSVALTLAFASISALMIAVRASGCPRGQLIAA